MDKIIKNFGGIIVLTFASIVLLTLKYTGVLAISLLVALSPLIVLVVLIALTPVIVIIMIKYSIWVASRRINKA